MNDHNKSSKAPERLLVVDDERLNIDVLVNLLKGDYLVSVAKSGEQALKVAASEQKPDLVLLDIMMPEMDGYEVCRRLKADPSTTDIPVIFVSAMGEESDETKGFEVGAVDYVTKPVSSAIVKARIRTHLTLKRNLQALQDAYGTIEAQKKRMQEELNVGRSIQLSMVPHEFPERPEFFVAARLEPAREVGGDFYDCFMVGVDKLCVCIGDVSGKGVPAALFMAMAKTLIKSRAAEDLSSASILTHVNDELCACNSNFMFVTIFLALVDIPSGKMVYTNAGHNPPFILTAGGIKKRLDTLHGPVVAAMENMAYKEDAVTIEQGDMLVLYTDGVTEAANRAQELYSERRLVDYLEASDSDEAGTLLNGIYSSVKTWEDGAEQADDITLLLLKYMGPSMPAASASMSLALKNQMAEIARVQTEWNKFAERHGLPASVDQKIDLVLDELLNNAISYGFADGNEHEIHVEITLQADKVILQITDDGIPFNPFQRNSPDTSLSVKDRQIGGLGVHLVKNLMDDFSYRRMVDKNVVTLIKLISAR